MSARQTILSEIQARNGSTAEAAPDFNIQIPSPEYDVDFWSNKTAHFLQMLEQVHGTWNILANMDEVPNAVMCYLQGIHLELRVIAAPDENLTRLHWQQSGVDATWGKAEKPDRVSVTMAYAGIAETGTIAMVSSAQSPVTLNFLPEVNIVVLPESRLVPAMEQFWPLVKQQPRAVNFITGPSKTADIEQTIVYGAHGPKKFHVLIIKDSRNIAMQNGGVNQPIDSGLIKNASA